MAATTARTWGVTPVETVRSMSGLEFLSKIRDGELPAPPIARTLDFDLAEIEHGRAVFEGTPGAQHYNPLGSVHAGYAATLLDSCMACAVQSTLAQGFGYTTVEFKINLVRALTGTTGKVRAEGKVLSGGRRIATAEGALLDQTGKLLAHATTTCLIFEL